MSDIIKLLPDSIANQIAAGEVIQRPASIVKELLENAIDAGADEIKMILKDSGKTLVQVIDNGKGMSETDARMAFERHATSKITSSDDLAKLRTMGFRGEALASIAAIAQVELITKTPYNDLGTKILIEGSKVKTQEYISAALGTSIAVKNLFYNVPARRKFLKSDPVELRHVLDEFHRVAMAYPELFFSLHHNGNEVYHLPKSNLRQRIVSILGKTCNDKLVPVEEFTDIINIAGFTGKAEAAKKTKGEQYFFVNRRFIKSAYLSHAVRTAYDELITKDYYPLYVLFLELDPASIDINVHPTKQEIKFEDERLIYNYLKVAIRHAIGRYSITPQLDFQQPNRGFDDHFLFSKESPNTDTLKQVGSNTNFSFKSEKPKVDNWESVYNSLQNDPFADISDEPITLGSKANIEDHTLKHIEEKVKKSPYQIHNSYIVNHIRSGFLIIDQQYASERILYEQHLKALSTREQPIQKSLFPETIELEAQQAEVLNMILDKVNMLGFQIEHFGGRSFIIQGVPAGMSSTMGIKEMVNMLVHQYGENMEFQMGIDENLARSLAYSSAIKRGQHLSGVEMQSLIDLLFACDVPFKSPSGKKCFITMELEDLQKRFI